jgi:ParB-like chromosome segregation protein Spo0J
MRIVSQQFVIARVDSLTPHPENPNRGNVGAISESIDANGFYGVVGFQRSTRRIIFGNHRFEAAKQSGAAEIPALDIDVDDDTALRIMLVDNRTATFAENDNEILADILSHLSTTDAALEGTGFTPEYLDELLADLGNINQNFDDADATDATTDFEFVEFTLRVPKQSVDVSVENELEAIALRLHGRVVSRART